MSDVVIRVTATPASAGTPTFSSGCGGADGTSTCDLGKVDAGSAGTQLQVRVTVPASATAVTAVSLTACASAAELTSDATASVPVWVTAPPAAKQNKTKQHKTKQIKKAATTPATPAPGTQTPAAESTAGPALSTGSLMALPSSGSGPTLNPGGSAAGLFPTLNPTQAPSPSASATPSASPPSQVWNTRPMANTAALPEGTSAIGAQLAGLAALALAFLLAATRLKLRRRPAAKPAVDQDGGKDTPDSAG